MEEPGTPAESGPALKRELGLFDATMLVAGSMIGSGIFIVSADIGRTVGCAGGLLACWVLAGLITLAGALCYGELASMMPHAGGQYVFLREAYGPLIAFLYGWTFVLVIQTGTIAAVAVAFAKYAGLLAPFYSEQHVLFAIGSFKISAAQLLAIAMIVVLTAVNMRGLRHGRLVQNFFTTAKIVSLVFLIVVSLGLARGTPAAQTNLNGAWHFSWTQLEDQPETPPPIGADVWAPGGVHKVPVTRELTGLLLWVAIGVAMVGSLFACDAWNNVTFAAGEVVQPQRNLPLSLIFGTGLVTLIYTLVNVGYLNVLPVVGSQTGGTEIARGIQFATNDRVAAAAVQVIFSQGAVALMAILIMVSTFGCNNGLILSGARVSYAMAHDGLFFRSVGRLNDNAVPGTALIVQSLWAAVLCLSGTYGDLLDYVIFAVLLFGILTVGAVFLFRFRKPDAPRPYRTWGYPFVPLFYIVAAAAICVDLLVFKPNYTWPGIGIVMLGLPVYFLWKGDAAGTPAAKELPE